MNGRVMLFSLGAGLAYTLGYYSGWTPFAYQFEAGRFVWGTPAAPAILWYGWLAMAAVAGLAAAAIPPRRIGRVLTDLTWLVPLVLIVAAVIYEKRWFL